MPKDVLHVGDKLSKLTDKLLLEELKCLPVFLRRSQVLSSSFELKYNVDQKQESLFLKSIALFIKCCKKAKKVNGENVRCGDDYPCPTLGYLCNVTVSLPYFLLSLWRSVVLELIRTIWPDLLSCLPACKDIRNFFHHLFSPFQLLIYPTLFQIILPLLQLLLLYTHRCMYACKTS